MVGHRWRIVFGVAVGLGLAAWATLAVLRPDPNAVPEGFGRGNGRIEATELHISTKFPGRVEEILVEEGDFVDTGQPLVRMRTETLEAERAEAIARRLEAAQAVATARSRVAMREADLASERAAVVQRQGELLAFRRRLERCEEAAREGAISVQEIDDERTRVLVGEATLHAAEARVRAAESAVEAAHAETAGAEAKVVAAEATVRRIEADLADSTLVAPRAGRVQYRTAQPGEVLPAGGRVLVVVDLEDVYMTFFLPERAAGRVALGAEARIVLDAAPDRAIPADISFVASVAQFTPKTVETAEERQKLMFRAKARIAPDLLRRHLPRVKTGLPGVAWVRLDPDAPWPAALPAKVVE